MTKVLRIDYAPYTLVATQAPNSKTKATTREGALLRFTFKEYGCGYADCHPLIEFGDESLKKQLGYLEDKKFTNLTGRSLYFATLDAQFRSQKISAFDEIKHYPKNHFTSPALIKKEDILLQKENGFSVFKFKFGTHEPNEINYVQNMAQFFRVHSLKMRLDFNGNLKNRSMFDELVSYADIIDFIEDPYQDLDLKNQNNLEIYKEHFQFASDFIPYDDSKVDALFSTIVIKPARQNIQKLNLKSKKIVFTSSMDHPLGQVCALYESCTNADKNVEEPFGLITHHLFNESPYSKMLSVKKAVLCPPGGFGFGFDGLLKQEHWRKCFG